MFFFFAVGVEMGDWQEVWDENSGCYYYWNTLTNEVSWELPHYLADQVQSLGQTSNRWEELAETNSIFTTSSSVKPDKNHSAGII